MHSTQRIVVGEKMILELKGARVTYGHGDMAVNALQSVDLNLKAGECLGIAGESGCGKSTLAHLLVGLLPSGSHLEVEHFSIDDRPAPSINSKNWRSLRGSFLSMIFQDPIGTLNPFWTIGQQLKETLRFHHLASSDQEANSLSAQWLDRVRINDIHSVMNRFPHQLSGGMCQRVNLALALCTQPKVLIADEPTTALDVTTQKAVLDLISELSRDSGMAVILVSHDLGVLSERCQRVMVMYAGQAMEWGPTSSVISNPRHAYTKALLNAQPPLHGDLPEKLSFINPFQGESTAPQRRGPSPVLKEGEHAWLDNLEST